MDNYGNNNIIEFDNNNTAEESLEATIELLPEISKGIKLHLSPKSIHRYYSFTIATKSSFYA